MALIAAPWHGACECRFLREKLHDQAPRVRKTNGARVKPVSVSCFLFDLRQANSNESLQGVRHATRCSLIGVGHDVRLTYSRRRRPESSGRGSVRWGPAQRSGGLHHGLAGPDWVGAFSARKRHARGEPSAPESMMLFDGICFLCLPFGGPFASMPALDRIGRQRSTLAVAR